MPHLLAFWNLENLFAPENHPDRPAWVAAAMKRDLTGWTEALFNRKLDQLASVITRMKGGAGPDILGVCEVENRFALQSLADRLNARLPQRRYATVHVDAEQDQRGIDTAFIHDTAAFTLKPGELFSHFVMRRTGTRDITQATFVSAAGNELVVLCNHWPSRSAEPGEGPEYSAGFRATAGETLGYWHERIRDLKGGNVPVLAFGDFNDDPYDRSLTVHASATRERGDVQRAQSARLYNLAWRYLTQAATDHRGNARILDGTLYNGGDGHVFDQILVSRGLLLPGAKLRVLEETARIEAMPEMVDHRVGEGALRFGLPKGDVAANVDVNGYSDHFPVSVQIAEG
jgi:predicted extracellular nuclease